MSVLIKGMGMPKSCDDCKLKEATASWWICDITSNMNEPEYYADKRPSDCPLVEVPTPHGRLIDADALVKSMHDFSYMWGERMNDEWVGEAPTIIESGGE